MEVLFIQSTISQDILLQQLQLQQLVILSLVLLVILLIPVCVFMIKKHRQSSTHWKTLVKEMEQVNQDATFRNEAQKGIISSLHERLNILEGQMNVEPSYYEYDEILGFYRKISPSLIRLLEAIQLSTYEMFICILIYEKVPLKEIATLLGKNYDAIKKRKQRIQNKMRLSGICGKEEQCVHCPLREISQICPVSAGSVGNSQKLVE